MPGGQAETHFFLPHILLAGPLSKLQDNAVFGYIALPE